MQNVDSTVELDCENSAVCIALVVINDLDNTGTTKSS
jgi:hypothetical protein